MAVVIFTWFASWYGGNKRYVGFAVALLVGGTLGNLIDRLSYGAVIDFVDVHFADRYHWAAFNVADAAVSVATALILIRILKSSIVSERSPEAEAHSEGESGEVFEPATQQEPTD